MNKFKQCTYTLILLLTCLVASPMIYKQIWDSSQEKKKAESYKPPVIDLNASAAEKPSEPAEKPTEEKTSESGGEDTTQTTSENGSEPAEETTDTTTDAPEVTEPSYNFVQSDVSYFDDAIFIGDSRMVGLRDYGTLKNASFYCDVGLAAWSLDSSTLASVLGGKTFGKVYLMLGINEVGNDMEFTASAFRKVVENIRKYQPKAVIYLCGNLHVTEKAQTSLITNVRLNDLNNRISQLADGKSIFYLDINPVFDDEKGNLRPDCTADGVHVFASYCQTWCEWFCLNTVDPNTVIYTENADENGEE